MWLEAVCMLLVSRQNGSSYGVQIQWEFIMKFKVQASGSVQIYLDFDVRYNVNIFDVTYI